MAYEHERDEWRSAVHALTEAERQQIRAEIRRAVGVIGDPTDDLGADDNHDPDEAA